MLKGIKEAAIDGKNVDPAVRTGFLLTLLVTSVMVGIYVSRKVKVIRKDRTISSADGLQSEEDEEEDKKENKDETEWEEI